MGRIEESDEKMEWLIILFGAIVFVGFYQTLTLLGKLKQKSDESASTLEDFGRDT